MAKLSAADTEKALRRSNGNGLSPIEPKAPSDATKNGAGDPRLARIRDASPQGFRCSTRNDFEMVRISSEDDEIGTCFGLIRQSSDQPTKGALQIDQTNADFNSHDSTQGNTLNLVRPDSASLRKSLPTLQSRVLDRPRREYGMAQRSGRSLDSGLRFR